MKQIHELQVGDCVKKRSTNEYCEITEIEMQRSYAHVFGFFGFCVSRDVMQRMFVTDDFDGRFAVK